MPDLFKGTYKPTAGTPHRERTHYWEDEGSSVRTLCGGISALKRTVVRTAEPVTCKACLAHVEEA